MGPTASFRPALGLTALGVVYGDIGTSPLYALHQAFFGEAAFTPDKANVLGVLGLIFWALVIVISLKYLLFVLRADDKGEGGILALMTLIGRTGARKGRGVVIGLGLFGAALLYGDGIITPAISVLSALEGLEQAAPALEPAVIPATLGVLIALFAVQHYGTERIGRWFGPVMLVWFVVLGALGIGGIVRAPEVLAAVDPRWAIDFFHRNGLVALLVFGAVFLVVTGGEALYADMGHVGAGPIRWMWFLVVLPGLVLNYFGQGALILDDPAAAAHAFYDLAPSWALWPLIALATLATVIASQAVISGVFSLSRQAVQLGYFPRLRITQTSAAEAGQIYVPVLNWAMLLGTGGLVIGFGSSGALASAYGVAVTTTMLITTALMAILARHRWRWPRPAVAMFVIAFGLVDLCFFAANILKIPEGGWLPLVIGLTMVAIMGAWLLGRRAVGAALQDLRRPLRPFVNEMAAADLPRVPGTAVVFSRRSWWAPPLLRRHVDLNGALHEQVVVLTVVVRPEPRVPAARRLTLRQLPAGFWHVRVHYGYMQSPNIPVVLRGCRLLGMDLDPAEVVYFVGRDSLDLGPLHPGPRQWLLWFFDLLLRNATRATDYYRLPPDRVIEFGIRIRPHRKSRPPETGWGTQ